MKPELLALVQVSAWTALLWIPYVLNRMLVWGLMDTMGYPAEKKPLAPWAERLRSAHANAIENLAVFAPLALAVHLLGIGNPVTAMAGSLFLWARIVHVLAYTFKLPFIRTLAFIGGFAAQMMLAWQLLAR